ncbi:MAG: PepSY domain-containing protein [Synergistaceae bacterium]|nr:PepSY domain-containing protein [Synergistaceae bacterium]
MSKKFFAVILFVLVLGIFAGAAFADSEHNVRAEALGRKINLITVEQAKTIAAEKLNAKDVTFKFVDLDNEIKDYPNGSDFRPVYEMECFVNGQEYDVDVDAVTGEVLKCKLDD